MFKCDECDKEFETEVSLRGHKAMHIRYNTGKPDSDKPDHQATPRQERKERIPFGSPKQRLTNPGDPKFVYRVFNDNWRKEPDRITRAKAAGYEIVDGYPGITVGTNDDGTSINGILMKIPKEFYEADQKLKQQEIDKVDREIHRGKFQEKTEDKRYIPTSGIQIETKLTP